MRATDCSTVPDPAEAVTSVWVVMPVHNNHTTVQSVALRSRPYANGVLVVDDGSTDGNVADLFKETDIVVLRHPVNRGKGAALRSAAHYLHDRGVAWMITMDGDGQHHPEDVPTFLDAIQRHPHSIIVGARDFSSPDVPASSRFGRRFSNLWIRLESGASVSDSQSGFRAYPLRLLAQMRLRGDRYEFEVDVLTRAVWHGLSLVDVPVRVWYPRPDETLVSSFRPWRDNVRISLLHARLCMRRLWPWPHRRLTPMPPDTVTARALLAHPHRTIKRLLIERSSPIELGIAAALGTFLAVLPLIGAHTAAIFYFATRFRLNLLMALNIQHLYAPPFTPIACITLGHYALHGKWITLPGSLKEGLYEVPHYLLYWLLGSVVLAPALALLAGGLIYLVARSVTRSKAN
jgi:uncharacterized protein (DUF2062 family)